MTEQQKSIIKTLREQNFSYSAIAKAMGVTVATVKSYCQRSWLAGNRPASRYHRVRIRSDGALHHE